MKVIEDDKSRGEVFRVGMLFIFGAFETQKLLK